MVAGTDSGHVDSAKYLDCYDSRFRTGAIYLHLILEIIDVYFRGVCILSRFRSGAYT